MKAIYWRQTVKGYLCMLIAGLLFFLIPFLHFTYGSSLFLDILGGIVFVLCLIRGMSYLSEKRAVFLDDRMEIDLNRLYIYIQNVYSFIPVDISDLFDGLSSKYGKRSIKYEKITSVMAVKDENEYLLQVLYKSPWDTNLRLSLRSRETGKQTITELVKEFRKRSHGENYRYLFEDRAGLLGDKIYVPSTESAYSDSRESEEPYEVR